MNEFREYKGNLYLVLGIVSIKHPDSGEWIEAYLYTDFSGSQYARYTKDFEEKFKVVKVTSFEEVKK